MAATPAVNEAAANYVIYLANAGLTGGAAGTPMSLALTGGAAADFGTPMSIEPMSVETGALALI